MDRYENHRYWITGYNMSTKSPFYLKHILLLKTIRFVSLCNLLWHSIVRFSVTPDLTIAHAHKDFRVDKSCCGLFFWYADCEYRYVKICYVFQCNTQFIFSAKSDGKSFFRFPKEESIRRDWSIRMNNWICSDQILQGKHRDKNYAQILFSHKQTVVNKIWEQCWFERELSKVFQKFQNICTMPKKLNIKISLWWMHILSE